MKNKACLMVSISSIKDINKITKDTKYINIDITNPNYDVIRYFIENGHNYLYSDIVNDINGYNYIKYDDFIKTENLIEMIYANMPNNLTKIEIAKYLYISLGNCLSSSINADYNKTELYNLELITSINNLWGSLSQGITTSNSCTKLYYYLLRRLDIPCEIIKEDNNIFKTKLKINNKVLIVDLYNDIPFIQNNMQTKYFATYNDDLTLDKKIKYIKNKYNDYYLDKTLKDIDLVKEDCIFEILLKTQKILKINNINPTELSIIYRYIFDNYCPNYNIKINNLYLNDNNQKHFIMISYNDNHYSYNYKKKTFIKVNEEDIINNLQIGKIGIYSQENIPNITNYLECIN